MKIYKTKAITLIELLVSIGILAVTVSLAATFIRFQKPNIELYQAARELRATLGAARGRALTNQQPYQVHFSIVSNQYELKEAAGAGATVQTVSLPAKVQFYNVGPFLNDAVIFNPAGAAEPAGTITLQNSNNKQTNIIISPAGYIRIE